MKYAIVSDIHANLEALSVVMEQLRGRGVGKIVCLGDTVGFNTNPNECLDRLIGAGAECVAGNHDLVALGKARPDGFSVTAKTAIRWTREQLTSQRAEFLSNLPENRIIDAQFVICHGSLRSPHEYVNTVRRVRQMFEDLANGWSPLRLCFFGHTHLPRIHRLRNESIETLNEVELTMDPDAYYLVNPGSVGQSRDHDPRASFLIYEPDTRQIQFCRVEYDYDACRRKTEAAGLLVPSRASLARRLYDRLRGELDSRLR